MYHYYYLLINFKIIELDLNDLLRFFHVQGPALQSDSRYRAGNLPEPETPQHSVNTIEFIHN